MPNVYFYFQFICGCLTRFVQPNKKVQRNF